MKFEAKCFWAPFRHILYLWILWTRHFPCLKRHWLWGSASEVPMKYFKNGFQLVLSKLSLSALWPGTKMASVKQVPAPASSFGPTVEGKANQAWTHWFPPPPPPHPQPKQYCFQAMEPCIGYIIYMHLRRLESRLSLTFQVSAVKWFFKIFLNEKLERKLSVNVWQGSRAFRSRLVNIRVSIATSSCPECFFFFPNLSTMRYFSLFWPVDPKWYLLYAQWNYNWKCSDLLV